MYTLYSKIRENSVRNEMKYCKCIPFYLSNDWTAPASETDFSLLFLQFPNLLLNTVKLSEKRASETHLGSVRWRSKLLKYYSKVEILPKHDWILIDYSLGVKIILDW